MAEILHQLIGSLSHYLQGFIHPRWLFGISVHQQYGRWYSGEGLCVWFSDTPGPWEVKKNLPPSLESNLPLFRLSFQKTTRVRASNLGYDIPQQLNIRWALTQETEIWRKTKTELCKTTRDTTPTNQQKKLIKNSAKSQCCIKILQLRRLP